MKAYLNTLIATGLLVAVNSSMATSILRLYDEERVATIHTVDTLTGTRPWLIGQMLAEPSSPYSDLVERPPFTNEITWQEVVDTLSPGMDEAAVLDGLRKELGITRARPWIDVMPARGFRDAFVSANATKAAIDADIFWHVLDMFGYANAERFSSHAVGLQVLREQMATVPADRQDELGIYGDVQSRIMRAHHPDQLIAHDLRYLDALVKHRLRHQEEDSGLPIAWRIARTAAAFRDARGYIGGPPCRPDATPHPRYAGTGKEGDERTPCFVASTDRAVHRWYTKEMRRPLPRPDAPHSGMARIGALLGALLPLLDIFAMAEVVEAVSAEDVVTEAAIARSDTDLAIERDLTLSCRIPE